MKTKTMRPTLPSAHSNTSTTDNPIHQALASRAHAKYIGSFGSVFGRHKDDDTVATTKTTDDTMAIDQSSATGVEVTFDSSAIEHTRDTQLDARSFASSTGLTRESTRSKLRKEKALNEKLLLDLKEMAARLEEDDDSRKTTISTSQRLQEATAQIAFC
jgi:hypothetical protein